MDLRNNLFGKSNAPRGNVGLPGRQVGGGAGGPPPPRPGAPGDSRPGSYGSQAPSAAGRICNPSGPAGPATGREAAPGSMADRYIFGNLVAVSPDDFQSRDGGDVYVMLMGGNIRGEYVVTARPTPGFPSGGISLSDPQRRWCGIGTQDTFVGVQYDPFSRGTKAYLGTVDLEIAFASPKAVSDQPYDQDELAKVVESVYQNQILAPGQRFLMDYQGVKFTLTVKTISLIDLSEKGQSSEAPTTSDPNARGILFNASTIQFFKDASSTVNLKASSRRPVANAILRPDFKFADMGIGGLDDEFATIFRRAFQSRLMPPFIVEQMGLPHVKGLLLFGPPGTGKTLIARQIGKMLNAREPKIINGPEILNKFVGQSEENVRKMFADAEKEYKEKGDESGLHIIIFDELDAVCKQRGSGGGGGTGVGDSVVNQLLTKLDGVEQLNNILLIGMTNRKDMIDEALLRPGRLEVHVEIALPDEHGRQQILKIHTGKMRDNNRLADDVDIVELAAQTKNFSGAEINGLCKAAVSYAFNRHVKTGAGSAGIKPEDVEQIKLKQEDFVRALDDVKPAFGVSEDELERARARGIIPFSPHIGRIQANGSTFASQVADGTDSLFAILLYGPRGSGKTALAADIALNSEFPFVKMVAAKNMVGMSEAQKIEYIKKAFTDAYKSTQSILILDEIETMISYSPVGPRFQSEIATSISVLMRAEPPKGRRLLVIGTTSRHQVLEQLDMQGFNQKLAVPCVSDLRELQTLLSTTGVFQDADINEALHELQSATGTQRVDVGVKEVLSVLGSAVTSAKRDSRSLGLIFATFLSDVMSSM
ncbi:uncharacterized protein PG998_009917 [Apiospora kogelbergensis]|uniref:uncharacterized protein n=1 Tax=Apiospora kogelbergensis TaxID=1337665 RepID=UPI003131D0CA